MTTSLLSAGCTQSLLLMMRRIAHISGVIDRRQPKYLDKRYIKILQDGPLPDINGVIAPPFAPFFHGRIYRYLWLKATAEQEAQQRHEATKSGGGWEGRNLGMMMVVKTPLLIEGWLQQDS